MYYLHLLMLLGRTPDDVRGTKLDLALLEICHEKAEKKKHIL